MNIRRYCEWKLICHGRDLRMRSDFIRDFLGELLRKMAACRFGKGHMEEWHGRG